MNSHAKRQRQRTIFIIISLLMLGSLLAACGGAEVEPTPAGPPTLPPPVLRMLVNPPEPEIFLETTAANADDETSEDEDTDGETATNTPDAESTPDESESEGDSEAEADTTAEADATVTAEDDSETSDGDELTETPEGDSDTEVGDDVTPESETEGDAESEAEPTAVVAEAPVEIDYPAAEDALERAIHAQIGLSVDIQIVERSADALTALCGLAATDLPTIAWLDGLVYVAAVARQCGHPSLQISRDETTGQTGQIIIDRGLGTTSLTVIGGRTYCRLGYTDLYSWLLPSIALETVSIDLTQDVEVVDYADTAALVNAIVDGECTMTGISGETLERLGVDPDAVGIGMTMPPLPYGVLVFAPEVELGVRLGMERVLTELSETSEGAALLLPFLAQDALLPVAPDDFADLRGFLADSNIDLVQLGE